MFIFERCDAMPHNYPLVGWLTGCTSLIHDSIDTCGVCPSLRAALLVASLLLRRQDRIVVLAAHCSTSTVKSSSRRSSSRGLVDLSSTLHGPGTVHAVVAQADGGTAQLQEGEPRPCLQCDPARCTVVPHIVVVELNLPRSARQGRRVRRGWGQRWS